jgi:hypothetical protein
MDDIKSMSDEKLKEILSSGDPNTKVWRLAQAENTRRDAEEGVRRHKESMAVASGANHIAKWAIIIALLALIVSIIETFWPG